MRRIKRTKITVIRTEAFFLKNHGGEVTENCWQIQTAELLENNKKDSVLEIEPIKQIENTDSQGETL